MVRITVVVRLLVTDVSLGGGGGGDTMPPEPICPARAETASNKLRVVAAHVWRKGFMVPPTQNFCVTRQILHGTIMPRKFLARAVITA